MCLYFKHQNHIDFSLKPMSLYFLLRFCYQLKTLLHVTSNQLDVLCGPQQYYQDCRACVVFDFNCA